MADIAVEKDLERMFSPSPRGLSLWRHIWGLFRLVRPAGIIGLAAGVFLGGLSAAGLAAFEGASSERLLIAALSAILLGAGGSSIYDVFNSEIDGINHPNRPVPSGLISVRAARWVWVVTTVSGMILGLLVSPLHFIIALFTAGLFYVHGSVGRRILLLQNLIIAFAVPFVSVVYGGLAARASEPVAIASVFVFLMLLSIGIVYDLGRITEHAVAGFRTLPVRFGAAASSLIVSLILLFIIVLSPLPFLFLGYGGLYLLVILIADGLLLVAIKLLQTSDVTKNTAETCWIQVFSLLIGLFAFALGRSYF